MATSTDTPVVLYHYVGSPVSARVLWYLTLRGIPYTECMQPMIIPRPDIEALGVKYRRIPILAIGRDIYLDSRLILQKLQSLPPSPSALLATTTTPEQRATEDLLEAYIMGANLFRRIIALLSQSPVLEDPAFVKDRTEMMGGFTVSREVLEMGRPEATNEMRGVFGFFEETLLRDGREWIAGGREPSLADIQALWPLEWMYNVRGAYDATYISPSIYPKVFAWMARFRTAITTTKEAQPPQTVPGAEASKLITSSSYNETNHGQVDDSDPVVRQLGLKRGQRVQMWPTDVPPQQKDSGRLLSMDGGETVIEVEAGDGTVVRVHAPRRGFKVVAVEE